MNEEKLEPVPEEWKWPDGLEHEDVETPGLPGMPPSTVRRALVHPELRHVPTIHVRCPRCHAEGEDTSVPVIRTLASGRPVDTDCSRCNFPIRLKVKQKPRIITAHQGMNREQLRAIEAQARRRK